MQAVRVHELETENAFLRERVSQLDERTNTLSKEIVRAKFRGQQQVELDMTSSGKTVQGQLILFTGPEEDKWRS